MCSKYSAKKILHSSMLLYGRLVIFSVKGKEYAVLRRMEGNLVG